MVGLGGTAMYIHTIVHTLRRKQPMSHAQHAYAVRDESKDFLLLVLVLHSACTVQQFSKY